MGVPWVSASHVVSLQLRAPDLPSGSAHPQLRATVSLCAIGVVCRHRLRSAVVGRHRLTMMTMKMTAAMTRHAQQQTAYFLKK